MVRTKAYGVTDRRGRFDFASLPAGRYTAAVWDRRVVRISGRVELALLGARAPEWCWVELYGMRPDGGYRSAEPGAKVRADGSFEIEGVPPGRYELSIGAMFREPGERTSWETRMFVHDCILELGPRGIAKLRIVPVPRPPKPRD